MGPTMNFLGSSTLRLSLVSIFTLTILIDGSKISKGGNKKYFLINSSKTWKEAKHVSFDKLSRKLKFKIWDVNKHSE